MESTDMFKMDKVVALACLGVILLLCFTIYMMYRKIKRIENDVKAHHKVTNEFTNVKYMVDDVAKQVLDLQNSVTTKKRKDENVCEIKKPVVPLNKLMDNLKKSSVKTVEVETVDDIPGEESDDEDVEVLEANDD